MLTYNLHANTSLHLLRKISVTVDQSQINHPLVGHQLMSIYYFLGIHFCLYATTATTGTSHRFGNIPKAWYNYIPFSSFFSRHVLTPTLTSSITFQLNVRKRLYTVQNKIICPTFFNIRSSGTYKELRLKSLVE